MSLIILIDQLKHQKLKLVTAESCTAGGLAYFLTSLPGSSTWFERGFVTYSNNSKKELLGVRAETLNQFGAVSEETAREMAQGALQNSAADISIAITGIAGPDGGSDVKPVGTVIFGISLAQTTAVQRRLFKGNRDEIRERAIDEACSILIQTLKSKM